MFGGCAEDYEAHIELLPDIAPIFYAFCDLRTQWRYHPMAGATGLIYSSIPVVLMVHGIKHDQQAQKDLMIMEAAALTVMNAKPEEGPENAS